MSKIIISSQISYFYSPDFILNKFTLNDTIAAPTMDIERISTIVVKILWKFSDIFDDKSPKTKIKYHHIEVELSRDQDFCSIQVANYGKVVHDSATILEICNFVYSDMNLEDNSALATGRLKKSNVEREEIFHVSSYRNSIRLKSKINTNQDILFSQPNDYFMLQIMQKIQFQEVDKFVKTITTYLEVFRTQYSRIKYVLKMGDHEFHSNCIALDNDFAKCKLLSSSIETIVMQSVRENFRQECFDLLSTDHSSGMSEKIMMHLVKIFNKRFRV